MSYDKIIGFGINQYDPKARASSSRFGKKENEIFLKMGVEPIFCDLKKLLPSNREPEQKLLLRSARDFGQIRVILTNASNTFLIPGQNYENKNPLVSLLLDTPTGTLERKNHSLRYRFEIDPTHGSITQADFNEKTSMKSSHVIGGCTDRFEREMEQTADETTREAYDRFIQLQRSKNDPLGCDGIAFNDLNVGLGYIAARNEIGIAFKHPSHPVLFVFEACEDIWAVLDGEMKHPVQKYYEWEIEPKQVWGKLPAYAQNTEGFKSFLYEAMTMIRDHLQSHIPGSLINMSSKAELARDQIALQNGIDQDALKTMGMTCVFEYAMQCGASRPLNIILEQKDPIFNIARQLDTEKRRNNKDSLPPAFDMIGRGERFRLVAA